MIDEYKYHGWTLSFSPKPMPSTDHDWEAVHDDYDGPEDERAFTGRSIYDLIEQIDEWEQEQ